MNQPAVRPARPEEAAAIAALLRRSIRDLCAADHQGDTARLDAWLANKTPESVARWLGDPEQRLVVAEIDGRLAGVGAARRHGDVLLNYVSPDFTRRGVSSAILAALEGWMRASGSSESRLETTETARAFYRARGYRPDAGDGNRLRKPLGPVELVLFDCDGVLVDSEPIAMRLLLETLDEAGLPLDADEAHARFLGRSLASTREILAEEYRIALTDAALAEMRGRLYAAFRSELRPIPGIAAALDALPCRFCVASSSQPERIELSLTVTGLWPRFQGRAFSATMVARGKPAPDLFLFAAERMGYAPAACLVVEDSPAGILAAQAAGMRVVAFTGGGHATGHEHLAGVRRLEPDAVIADMSALPGLVRDFAASD